MEIPGQIILPYGNVFRLPGRKSRVRPPCRRNENMRKECILRVQGHACERLPLSLKVQEEGSNGEDFLFGEFRIDRERQTVLAQLFSDREIARFVTEMRVGLL